MTVEPERSEKLSDFSGHVMLMTRGPVALSYAGPGLTVQRLLKTHEESSETALSMSAVFGDRVFHSYGEFSRIVEAEAAGSAKKRSSGSWHFTVGLVLSTIRFMFNLKRARRKDKKSIVILHCHDLVSAYLSCRFYRPRYPLIFTLHGKGGYVREPLLQHPVFRSTFIEKFARHMETTAIKKADIVVFTSYGSQALFEDEYRGLLRDKDVRIIYPGVDRQELEGTPADHEILKRYGAGDGTSVILCVMALIKDKGIDTLIEAIGSLPEETRSRVTCLIVGRGHLKEEIQSMITGKGLAHTIRLLEFLPRQDLLDLLKTADFFVLPSRVAVFDQILLEVAAVGLPVITTSVGGNLEMFDESSALLIPPDNPPELVAAITRMLGDEPLRNRLARNALRTIRSRFSPESELDSYMAIYEELVCGIQ